VGIRRFVAIDTETTGLDPEIDRVVEVAWCVFDDGVRTATHESLVSSERPLPPVVVRLTGITPGLLARAPPFAEIADALVAAIAGADVVVAYNAAFDRAFLVRELARVSRALPDVPFVDPLQLVRALDDDVSHALSAVAERYGVVTAADHRALPDAIAAGEILVRLLPRLGAHDVGSLLTAQREAADRVLARREEAMARATRARGA